MAPPSLPQLDLDVEAGGEAHGDRAEFGNHGSGACFTGLGQESPADDCDAGRESAHPRMGNPWLFP